MPRVASVLVMAAVSVVLPWSTCPIVPTFTCGFVRSKTFLPITSSVPVPSDAWVVASDECLVVSGANLFAHCEKPLPNHSSLTTSHVRMSSRWESDPRPHAYQACALPLSYWSGTLLRRGLHGGQGEIRTPEGEAS